MNSRLFLENEMFHLSFYVFCFVLFLFLFLFFFFEMFLSLTLLRRKNNPTPLYSFFSLRTDLFFSFKAGRRQYFFGGGGSEGDGRGVN